MSFGKRRFTQLVYRENSSSGSRVSWYEAWFVPLAMGEADTYLTEADLIRAIEDNLTSRVPLTDLEEQLALRAFTAQAKNKTFSRAAVEAVAERGKQRVIVDVLEAGERAIVERFRKLLLLEDRPRTVQHDNNTDLLSRQTLHDTSRDVLRLVDKYFKKGS